MHWDDGPDRERPPALHAVPDEPPLIAEVREAIDLDHPLALLSLGSTFAELATDAERRMPMLADPDGFEPSVTPTWEMLLGGFSEASIPETTALLYAIEPFVPSGRARRLRSELDRRHGSSLPAWVRSFHEVEITGVWEQGHVLDDGVNVVLAARWVSGPELTVVIYIDNNMGTLVKDVITIPAAPGEVLDLWDAESVPGSYQRPLDPAVARARILDAERTWSMTRPPVVNDEWPLARPLVLWLAGMLPEGAEVPGREPYPDAERDALIEEFLDSPEGAGVRDDPDTRSLLESVLWFAGDYGVCHPLRWSPVRVEILLASWYPRKVMAEPEYLAKLPDLLRAFLPFALRRLGGADSQDEVALDDETVEEFVADALEAIDEWEPDYRDQIGDTSLPTGPYDLAKLLLSEMGSEADPEAVERLRSFVELGENPSERAYLAWRLGGEDELERLDDVPWPFETIELDTVPEDLRERVEEIDGILGTVCDDLLDDEYLTMARRVLGRIIDRSPDALRRRGASAGWAAGILVVLGERNAMFTKLGDGLTKKQLLASVGVKSIGSKDQTVMRSAHLDSYGPVRTLLHSRERRRLLDRLEEDGSPS